MHNCTSNIQYCNNGCGKYNTTPANNHVEGQLLTTVPAGCTTPGIKEKHCIVCNTLLYHENIAALGHKWKEEACPGTCPDDKLWKSGERHYEGNKPADFWFDGPCDTCGKINRFHSIGGNRSFSHKCQMKISKCQRSGCNEKK